jgi:ADP-heptose:LPS heptosyltransferase
MSRILFALRALGLGDLLTAVPALRALRHGFPDHEIVLATPASVGPLALASGAVDRIFDTPTYVNHAPGRLYWTGPPPDVAVNLHGQGPQSHRALMALRAWRLLAFASEEAGFTAGPVPPPAALHEVDRWCALLSAYRLAVDPTDMVLTAPDPGPDRSGAVVVHPGAAHPSRRWPADRYALLVRRLVREHQHVVMTGTRAERAECLAIAGAGGLATAHVYAGRTTTMELASLIGHARLVVCGDTGVAHLATALRTPSVLLFGPMSPSAWGPRIDIDRHTVLWKGPDGLRDITVSEVHSAAMDILRGADAPASR